MKAGQRGGSAFPDLVYEAEGPEIRFSGNSSEHIIFSVLYLDRLFDELWNKIKHGEKVENVKLREGTTHFHSKAVRESLAEKVTPDKGEEAS